MRVTRRSLFLPLTALMAFSIGSAHAGYVRHMNLRQLCESAGRIFRGTVVEATPGTVELAGGRIPIITYRVRVLEAFQGVGETREVEVRMLDPKVGDGAPANGSIRAVPLLGGLPTIEVGKDYLLFTTQPSRAGLSTTVGLGQGSFRIRGGNKAVNGIRNVGLFRGMATSLAASSSSTVDYQTLAGEIRRLLSAQ